MGKILERERESSITLIVLRLFFFICGVKGNVVEKENLPIPSTVYRDLFQLMQSSPISIFVIDILVVSNGRWKNEKTKSHSSF